jgi:hybrid cluster-associated redox disulfide protein
MFTKDTLLLDAFKQDGVNVDAMADVLACLGMHCLGCALSSGETIGEAAEVHGIDVDLMLNSLNEAAQIPNK